MKFCVLLLRSGSYSSVVVPEGSGTYIPKRCKATFEDVWHTLCGTLVGVGRYEFCDETELLQDAVAESSVHTVNGTSCK